MSRKTLLTLLSAAGLLMASGAFAADPAVQGAAIAKNGEPGATACDTCHGAGTANFPLLAGQRKDYIMRQLKDFRSGKRDNALMVPIAKALSEAQSEAVATHYSLQIFRKAPGPGAPQDLLERGAELAVGGDTASSCDTCHGKSGVGGIDFVALAGQNPAYIAAQIQAFRDGKRTNDNLGMMRNVAKKLKEGDIKAVAAFYREVMDLVVEVPE